MKLALWQTPHRHNPDAALRALEVTAGEARARGADILVVPEMFLGGYNIGSEAVRILAQRDAELTQAVSAIARTNDLALIVGLVTGGPDGVHNSAMAVARDGEILAIYHKTHLFGDVDRSQFLAGPVLPPVVTLANWRVGLAICYDIEFPEIARHLADAGAELIVVPTANMTGFDSVPQRLVPARAEENALFVAYANAVGREGEFRYGGLSCVCGADGDDLVRAGRDEALIFADLDRKTLLDIRAQSRHRADRRRDLY